VLLRDVDELTIDEIAQSLSLNRGSRQRPVAPCARADPGIFDGIAPYCSALAWRRTMTMTMAILGSALFFVVAPSVLAGLIPWWMTHWEFLPPFFDLQATRVVGALLILAGLPGLVDSFARFASQGLGTPAPIAPPQNLVVTGLYRYVRNPMYVAVVAVILGQAFLFGDWRLVTYGALMWLAFHAFVLAYEEPVLAQSFGTSYEDFRANVPRWIPRLSPWRPA
jgi:protein-S-isoprenylcysteine O-methyltransferase Ste14